MCNPPLSSGYCVSGVCIGAVDAGWILWTRWTAAYISRMLILVMGVAGSGKTLIGNMLAESLHYIFADADHFHPAANIEKMTHGVALTDDDRQPWLLAIRQAIEGWTKSGQNAVLACSALKQSYR